MHQSPLFVYTSQGYLNLALVRRIVEDKEKKVTRFIYTDQEETELPYLEGCRVVQVMVGELFVYPE
jgi:hypothetical protein